jgi:hypothetical protein
VLCHGSSDLEWSESRGPRQKEARLSLLCLFLDSLLRPKSELYSNTRDARLISSLPGDQKITKVDCLRPSRANITARSTLMPISLVRIIALCRSSILHSPKRQVHEIFRSPINIQRYGTLRPSQVGFCSQSTSVTSLGFVMASRQCALVYSQIYNSSDVRRGNLILAMVSMSL